MGFLYEGVGELALAYVLTEKTNLRQANKPFKTSLTVILVLFYSVTHGLSFLPCLMLRQKREIKREKRFVLTEALAVQSGARFSSCLHPSSVNNANLR